MSWELPDPRRDEDCGCRTGATCPDHLNETDFTLEHVPMGAQTLVDEREAA